MKMNPEDNTAPKMREREAYNPQFETVVASTYVVGRIGVMKNEDPRRMHQEAVRADKRV
jgi:hypothetical protein